MGHIEEKETFIDAINGLSGEIHEISLEKGFWTNDYNGVDETLVALIADLTGRRGFRQVWDLLDEETVSDIRSKWTIYLQTLVDIAKKNELPRVIALMHSELSEALDADRKGNPESEKIPGFSHVEEEMADTMIRIMDWAGAENVNIGAVIAAKVEFNKTRSHMHGGKKY